MSHLRYVNYEKIGDFARQFGYSQAVTVGNQLYISGQGGWNPKLPGGNMEIPDNPLEQIDRAFANVDLALRAAGGKGWAQVFKVVTYIVPLTDETTKRVAENFKKWMPNHAPLWTNIGVEVLGLPEMAVEVEVIADLGK